MSDVRVRMPECARCGHNGECYFLSETCYEVACSHCYRPAPAGRNLVGRGKTEAAAWASWILAMEDYVEQFGEPEFDSDVVTMPHTVDAIFRKDG